MKMALLCCCRMRYQFRCVAKWAFNVCCPTAAGPNGLAVQPAYTLWGIHVASATSVLPNAPLMQPISMLPNSMGNRLPLPILKHASDLLPRHLCMRHDHVQGSMDDARWSWTIPERPPSHLPRVCWMHGVRGACSTIDGRKRTDRCCCLMACLTGRASRQFPFTIVWSDSQMLDSVVAPEPLPLLACIVGLCHFWQQICDGHAVFLWTKTFVLISHASQCHEQPSVLCLLIFITDAAAHFALCCLATLF